MPLFREFLQPTSESPVPAPVQSTPRPEIRSVSSTLPIQPITRQPNAIENTLIPNDLCQHASCSPGLESLNDIDELFVHQGAEVLEALTGFETDNKYVIKNSAGQKVFHAVEKSDCCERQMCGSNRSFAMDIYDNRNQKVIHLFRDLNCGGCFCCTESMQVSAPAGHVIGLVEQELTMVTPKFYLKNESGEIVLTVKGPAISISFGNDVEFQVYSTDRETEIGKITKKWGGLMREATTTADNFGLTFPSNLNVKYKALLLGTCFLIDFIYFENR